MKPKNPLRDPAVAMQIALFNLSPHYDTCKNKYPQHHPTHWCPYFKHGDGVGANTEYEYSPRACTEYTDKEPNK